MEFNSAKYALDRSRRQSTKGCSDAMGICANTLVTSPFGFIIKRGKSLRITVLFGTCRACWVITSDLTLENF